MDLPLHIAGLTLDERRNPDRALQQASPQLVRRRDRMQEGDRHDLDAIEPLVTEETGELLRLREPKNGRSDRDLLRWLGSRLGHRIEKHAEKARLLGNIPDGERQAPTRDQHAYELRRGLLRASEVVYHEVPDHGIERAVGERESFGVSLAKIESRMKPAGERNHRLGDVDSNDRRAAFGGSGGHIAGTCGDVQHAHTGTDVDRVEQRLDEPTGDLAEEVVVAGSLPLPSRRLKRIERVFVDRRLLFARAILRPDRLVDKDENSERRPSVY
jgi:hypothetical protein